MEVRRLSEAEFFAAESRWDRFLAGSAANSFCLRHVWLALWWRRFRAHKELLVLEVLDPDGSTVGLAPFCISQQTAHAVLPMREVSFMGRQKVTGDYLDFICARGRETDVVGSVLRTLLDLQDSWDVLRISDIPEGSPTLRIMENVASSFGLELATGSGEVCPYLPLPDSWEGFMAGCSANMRSNLRRREKKLRALGARFVEKKGDAIPVALDALFELHAARWESRGKTGNFLDPRVQAFHHDLAPVLDAEGNLGLWTLDRGDRTIAAIYGFVHPGQTERRSTTGTFHYYQAGFDPEWSAHGVGMALMGYAIRRCIEKGLGEFDYLRGDEEYKRRWTHLHRRTVTKLLVPPGFRGWAWRALSSTRDGARRLLRREVP